MSIFLLHVLEMSHSPDPSAPKVLVSVLPAKSQCCFTESELTLNVLEVLSMLDCRLLLFLVSTDIP